MNAMQLGIQLFQEIEAERTGGNWRWEKCISGPLSMEDVSTIMRMAGCWAILCQQMKENQSGSIQIRTILITEADLDYQWENSELRIRSSI